MRFIEIILLILGILTPFLISSKKVSLNKIIPLGIILVSLIAHALLEGLRWQNPEIKAGINIDGAQWGNMVDTFFTKPFMWLSSDWPETHPNFNEVAYQNGSTADFYNATIKNSGHSNFTDIPFMINLSAVNESGTIESKQAIHITTELVVGFFNKYLNGETVDLLELGNKNMLLDVEKR